MLVGIDVYHAKKKFIDQRNLYRQRRSIGAFIAVIIDSAGNYRTSCDIIEVEARKELICGDTDTGGENNDLQKDIIGDAAPEELECPDITRENTLQNFITRSCTEHRVDPDLVIIYRDGVGDSQLEAVEKTEVLQVKRAINQHKTKLIYTIVQKRIHTRFMIKKFNDYGNPAPGTVISNDLGSERYEDFYLIPTKCINSTVKPVHYVILYYDRVISLEQLQTLTFTMCHCYPNWTDAIKLPFPTQLAHKLAYQMGESAIQKPTIHQDLYQTYFYL